MKTIVQMIWEEFSRKENRPLGVVCIASAAGIIVAVLAMMATTSGCGPGGGPYFLTGCKAGEQCGVDTDVTTTSPDGLQNGEEGNGESADGGTTDTAGVDAGPQAQYPDGADGGTCYADVCTMPAICKQNASDAPPVCWTFCDLAHKWHCGIDGVLIMKLKTNTVLKNTCLLELDTLEGLAEFGFIGVVGKLPPYMSEPESPSTSGYAQPSQDGKTLHLWDKSDGSDLTCTAVQ